MATMTVTEIIERPTTHIGEELPDISQYVRRQTSPVEVGLPEESDSGLSEEETESTGSIANTSRAELTTLHTHVINGKPKFS